MHFSIPFLFSCMSFGCLLNSNQKHDDEKHGNEKHGNEKKDILVLVMDTTRRDSFGIYGNSKPTTPYFDSLAKKGYLFEQAYAAGSWTWPSHASIFTGLYPWEHGAHFAIPTKEALSLKPDPLFASNIVDDVPTIAEILTDMGYESISVSANRLIGPDFPLIRGFSTSFFLDDDSKVAQKVQNILEYRRTENSQKPLFLFVNLMSAHSPWFRNPVPWVTQYEAELTPNTSPDWLKPYLLPDGIGIHPYLPNKNSNLIFGHISKTEVLDSHQLSILQNIYEGEVHRADGFMGEIVQHFTQVSDNYAIVITSDHGEYWGEHGLLDHGRTVYPEVLQVPLLVLDTQTTTNQNIQHVVSNKDIFSLLQSYATIGSKGGALFEPLVENQEIYASAEKDVHWAEKLGDRFAQNYRAVIRDDAMLVLSQDGNCEVIEGPADICTSTTIQKYKYLFEAQQGRGLNTDAEILKQLQQLGYVGSDDMLGQE